MLESTSESTAEIKKVQFSEYHKPALKSGCYKIEIKQTVATKDQSKISSTTFKKEQNFRVEGDRFNIPPQTIYGIYPPVGSQGNYDTTLPHIMFNRSTLPWERQPDSFLWLPEDTQTSDVPWLALLLFHEGEINKPQGIKLAEILQKNIQNEDDAEISVIDIPKELFHLILPTRNELKLLTHVRQGTKEDGTQAELAVTISNRLPKVNCLNTAYLVSLEKNFSSKPENLVRLISLKTWDFTCTDDSSDNHFNHLLTNLNKTSEGQTSPASNTLCLPSRPNLQDSEINQYLEMGYIPLLHHLRNGEKMVSFYHSPLLPGKTSGNTLVSFPVTAADDLFFYNSEHGLFDISYASAWQLGRLLALQSKNFSIDLYNWKRKQNLAAKTSNMTSVELLFNTQQEESEVKDIPKSVLNWFEDALLLKNVPFNYLVPSPEMLPPESLRFFWIDNYWLDCLIDGAFGIGNDFAAQEKFQAYQEYKQRISTIKPHPIVTGFLMRSEAVSGYPGIEIKGFDDNLSLPLPILRRERLSNDVLICLFSGEVKKVQVNQKAETLHFGFSGNSKEGLSKKLRDPGTGVLKNDCLKPPPKEEHWRDREQKIINIEYLANSILKLLSLTEEDNLNASQFALEMVEGFYSIEFKLKGK
jgi:hypothetical protein